MIPFFKQESKATIVNNSLSTNRREQVNRTDVHVYGSLFYRCLMCDSVLEVKNVPNVKNVANGLCQCISPECNINVGNQPYYYDKEFGYIYLKYLYHECKTNQIAVLQFIGAKIEGQKFLRSSKKGYDSSREKTINI